MKYQFLNQGVYIGGGEYRNIEEAIQEAYAYSRQIKKTVDAIREYDSKRTAWTITRGTISPYETQN